MRAVERHYVIYGDRQIVKRPDMIAAMLADDKIKLSRRQRYSDYESRLGYEYFWVYVDSE